MTERFWPLWGLARISLGCSQLSISRGVGCGARMGCSSCTDPRAEHPDIHHIEWEDIETRGGCAIFWSIPGASCCHGASTPSQKSLGKA